MKKAITLIPVLGMILACGPRIPLVYPEVSIVNLEVQEVKLLETTLFLTLRLTNENPVPLAVEGAVYNIFINGNRIGKGLSDAVYNVPRLNSMTDTIQVRTSNVALGMKIKEFLEVKEFDYHIDGYLYIVLDGRRRRMNIASDGYFSLQRRHFISSDKSQ